MRILNLNTTAYYPSSPLFLEALQELSQESSGQFDYIFVDEAPFERSSSILWRIGRRLVHRSPFARSALNQTLLERTRSFHPDLVLICKGAYVAPETLLQIKRETGAILVNYATDDPFNLRVSTHDLVDAIPLYDMYVCTKRAIIADVLRAGCRNVTYVPFAYKPSVHFPEPSASEDESRRFASDVVFIGGCDRDRVPFFKALVKAIPGLSLALYGVFWNRSVSLRRYWRGFALGRDFRMALSGTKIAINLVRRANRDGHVMRSFEIPACGAFMLAERTSEHLEHFAEDRDTAYFDSPEELVDKVRYYLTHEGERRELANAVHHRITRERHTYKDRLMQMIDAVRTGE